MSLSAHSIPRISDVGVYLLFDGERCVYVGSTMRSVARAFDHTDKVWDRCVFLGCEKKQVKMLERMLVSTLQPEHNKVLLGSFCESRMPWPLDEVLRRVRDAQSLQTRASSETGA